MVETMASAYEGLTEDERERVFLLAVGRDEYSNNDANFCRGFAACADDSGGPWWTALESAQRDVVFYIKADPASDDSWEFYCQYSMNTNRDEFDDTLREMLAITEASAIEEDSAIDDLLGNETMIEPEQKDEVEMKPTSFSDPEASTSDSGPINSLLSDSAPLASPSSHVAMNPTLSLAAGASILAWFVL